MLINEQSLALHTTVHEMGYESLEDFAIEMLRKQLQDEIKKSSSEIEIFENKYGMDYAEFVSRFDSLSQWTLFEKEDDSMDWKAETKLIRIYEKTPCCSCMITELLLDFSPIIRSTKILKSVERLYFSKLHLQLDLIDGSQLFIREIIIENILKEYSYHWQKSNGELIIRWDKHEHHINISTFPFHKHTNIELNIFESYEQDLKSVLLFIKSKIII